MSVQAALWAEHPGFFVGGAEAEAADPGFSRDGAAEPEAEAPAAEPSAEDLSAALRELAGVGVIGPGGAPDESDDAGATAGAEYASGDTTPAEASPRPCPPYEPCEESSSSTSSCL